MNNFHRFQNFRQFSNLFSQIRLKKRHTSLFSGICREIRTKFRQEVAEKKCKIRNKKWKNTVVDGCFHFSIFVLLFPVVRLHWSFARKNAKFDAENEKHRKFIFHSRKNVDDFWLKFWDLSGAKAFSVLYFLLVYIFIISFSIRFFSPKDA